MPFISVVIPAKNAEATLADTLGSLAMQSFRDFEVVLVNDGSTDKTADIAASFADRLAIKVVTHEESKGVAESINDGLNASDSDYVARLDADDMAAPQRLERQIAFLRCHPDIDVCGSHMQIFSIENGERVDHHVLAHPTESAEIRTALLQRCAIAHPSVLVRRSFFDRFGQYDPRFDFAEDYELWCRASLLGAQFANIPQVLTHYRRHANQVSSQKAQLQYERDIAIKARYMASWLQGENPGLLPQFIALQTQFRSRDIALSVLQQCGPTMTLLARSVPHNDEYARIVTGTLMRHFR